MKSFFFIISKETNEWNENFDETFYFAFIRDVTNYYYY
jgi:hypothetical protein